MKNILFTITLMFSAVFVWAGPYSDRHLPRFSYADEWTDEKGRTQRVERKFSSLEELQTACQNGDFRACQLLSGHYAHNNQPQKASVARNQMVELYQKDCAKNNIHTCELLARYYDTHHQKQKALDLYKKNCDLGDENGCMELNIHYSMQKDKAKTFYYQMREYEIRCRKNDPTACMLWNEMKKLTPNDVKFDVKP